MVLVERGMWTKDKDKPKVLTGIEKIKNQHHNIITTWNAMKNKNIKEATSLMAVENGILYTFSSIHQSQSLTKDQGPKII